VNSVPLWLGLKTITTETQRTQRNHRVTNLSPRARNKNKRDEQTNVTSLKKEPNEFF